MTTNRQVLPRQPGLPAAPRRAEAGFTLIELMIVLTIIATLISIAIPNYRHSLRVSKESVLRSNLQTLRQTIQNYTLDKQAAPNSLEDLVGAGYLREVPKDITSTTTSWQLVYCEEFLSPEQADSGLCDVKSGSAAISTEGTPYNTW
jgi:general secretion pathway protein G